MLHPDSVGGQLNIHSTLLIHIYIYIYIYIYCYGDISYHTPNMDSSNLNIFSELSSLGGDNFSDCKPSTASTSFVWLPFSANTITFTYHPLFELFFHWFNRKTTTHTHTHTHTYIYIYIYWQHFFIDTHSFEHFRHFSLTLTSCRFDFTIFSGK